jgi:hypothetical protein
MRRRTAQDSEAMVTTICALETSLACGALPQMAEIRCLLMDSRYRSDASIPKAGTGCLEPVVSGSY